MSLLDAIRAEGLSVDDLRRRAAALREVGEHGEALLYEAEAEAREALGRIWKGALEARDLAAAIALAKAHPHRIVQVGEHRLWFGLGRFWVWVGRWFRVREKDVLRIIGR